MPFDGVVRTLVSALKDRGEGSLAAVLAGPLAESVAVAVASSRTPPVLVVAPSSPRARRRRGEDPVHGVALRAAELVRAAGGQLDGPHRAVLRLGRRVGDQSRLGAAERWDNLAGAVVVADPAAVADRTCVVVDDVVTTGATLAEAARALRAAGASEVVGAALCATVRTGR